MDFASCNENSRNACSNRRLVLGAEAEQARDEHGERSLGIPGDGRHRPLAGFPVFSIRTDVM